MHGKMQDPKTLVEDDLLTKGATVSADTGEHPEPATTRSTDNLIDASDDYTVSFFLPVPISHG